MLSIDIDEWQTNGCKQSVGRGMPVLTLTKRCIYSFSSVLACVCVSQMCEYVFFFVYMSIGLGKCRSVLKQRRSH